MKKMTMRYPGDPPMPVIEMSRNEFLDRYPRTPMVIHNLDTGERDMYPTPPNEIRCDFCNEDPGETVVVLGDGLRGYCLNCAKSNWYPHCK